MVIFDQKSSKNTVFSDDFWSKMTIVSSLKPIKINRTPPFYLRGYGNYFDLHVFSASPASCHTLALHHILIAPDAQISLIRSVTYIYLSGDKNSFRIPHDLSGHLLTSISCLGVTRRAPGELTPHFIKSKNIAYKSC